MKEGGTNHVWCPNAEHLCLHLSELHCGHRHHRACGKRSSASSRKKPRCSEAEKCLLSNRMIYVVLHELFQTLLQTFFERYVPGNARYVLQRGGTPPTPASKTTKHFNRPNGRSPLLIIRPRSRSSTLHPSSTRSARQRRKGMLASCPLGAGKAALSFTKTPQAFEAGDVGMRWEMWGGGVRILICCLDTSERMLKKASF